MQYTLQEETTCDPIDHDANMAHAFLNYQHGEQDALLCEYIDLATHPTYVIPDSGCTRAMGSRFAIDRLVQACRSHKNSQRVWFETEPCSCWFSFANGEQSTVKERLVIYFKSTFSNTGWISTSIDILDKGKVPILFSVEQMRNLRMTLEHTPAGEFLTCPMFGVERTALAVSASNHPVLDIMALATSKQKPQYSFQSSALCCPGKHRQHTYKDDRKHAKPATKSKPDAKAKAKAEPKKKSTEKKKIDPDKTLDLKSEKVPNTWKEQPLSERPDGTAVAESSGPSSGHHERPAEDGRPDAQTAAEDAEIFPEDELPTELKEEEPKVAVKKEPGPSMNLPLSLQRIHAKLKSATELLKLYLKHYHMSTEELQRSSCPRISMISMILS